MVSSMDSKTFRNKSCDQITGRVEPKVSKRSGSLNSKRTTKENVIDSDAKIAEAFYSKWLKLKSLKSMICYRMDKIHSRHAEKLS